ncbi:probable Vitamin B6 transporter TPN1 [Saccharomycodes ludwigii]|uniref:Vitamin B6 transporter TPN1 n=1 Tax=Saccharomycodes ludwigii TaxID=36035 RepID=A0A376BBZ1_9ASCO|nr:hypothetical protein SCDLUD_001935 [Saccharomycodes ludwigii]KAH3902122.1 hypothetical protein SCDLUD_001935 [Saccharomycodes ludwigii]SSD62136.1 probable Vitamin B6 transporter TPN1 [Saccharomycodes ludwigii]
MIGNSFANGENYVSSSNTNKSDIFNEPEKKIIVYESQIAEDSPIPPATSTDNTKHHSAFYSFWRFIANFSQKIDSLGMIESTGIERIPSYQRGTKKTQFLHVLGFWISASGGLSSMSSFFLGPLLFGLTFKQSVVSGWISMMIGCLIAAYCSIMGPQSGCRQMVTARYLFGWYFVKFVALVSIIGVLGWSVVNCVVGGEMLASIGNVPIWVGIVIVTCVSIVVAICGIKQVLRVEMYLSIPVMTVFTLLFISGSDKFHLINEYKPTSDTSIKGNWLCFFSLCYSITSTWGSITSDYYILFPEDTPKIHVFLLTFFGLLIPTTYVGLLALCLASTAMSYEPWLNSYNEYGMGGMLWSGFQRWNGFGKFCVVVLLLSLISNNIINTYSAAFSVQLSSVRLAKIPRWFWAFVVTAIYLICALVGRNHFSDILSNFLPMIGYWISMYFILLFEENVIFRKHFLYLYTREFPNLTTSNTSQLKQALKYRKVRYNWEAWEDDKVLTRGLAATFAFICGIGGVAISMSQTYWIGPVAVKLDNGDIAMWLSMGISGLVYPPCRYLELKKFGR